MIRKIIRIDGEKCNGCGACAAACHEGAIEMKNGRAVLTREDYCDGLGDCLPACPVWAISFEEREAPAYDQYAVEQNKIKKLADETACACLSGVSSDSGCCGEMSSKLAQWPVQIKLAPAKAPYFEDANLLIAADCTAYAYGDFHNRFMGGHITLIGCPKLDGWDYSDKLAEIIKNNGIKSVTVTRMEVPCCGGMENAVKRAIQASGKALPLKVETITTDGRIKR